MPNTSISERCDPHQHPRHRICTALAVPLVRITLFSAGAPRLSPPQQVGA